MSEGDADSSYWKLIEDYRMHEAHRIIVHRFPTEAGWIYRIADWDGTKLLNVSHVFVPEAPINADQQD